jgi:hypothetical protein
MKLPNAEYAVVEETKIVRYLLDPTNPRNRGKRHSSSHSHSRRQGGKQWRRRCGSTRIDMT